MNIIYCILFYVDVSLIFAYDDLSYKKNASQLPAYGGRYYEASNAVDGNRTTCMRTNAIGTGFTYPYKAMWWKVDLSGVYSIYSITIMFKNYDGYGAYLHERQRGRFAGFSLHISDNDILHVADIKSSTLCYKNGQQLPSLNFTTTCEQFGRYVIFYNERLDGVIYPEGYELQNIYTELCEVIVHGCKKSGMHGSNCNVSCPINCKDNLCHLQNGTCYTCKSGWTGSTCRANCRAGLHGLNCSQQCVGHCRDGATCNHVTGQCDRGCNAGWIGVMCDRECNDGTYGYNCINTCSGHCLNDSPCNKQTGHCKGGCDPGYTNIHCMDACSSGYFGLNCKNRCRGYCIYNESCDHVSGVCHKGCQDGYTGAFCNAYCIAGYYGRNCSLLCSSNCTKCRHTDGVCIYPQNADTIQVVPFSTLWIVGFSISFAVNVIFICAVSIRIWRPFSGKDVSVTDHFCCRGSESKDNQSESNDGISHYQELSVSNGENTYQTLTLK